MTATAGRLSTVLSIYLLIAVSVCVSAQQPEGQRIDPPNEQEQAEALELLKSIFHDDYRTASTPKSKIALASRMIQVAGDTTDDPSGRFVLLRIARDVASMAGSVSVAHRAIDQMARHYLIDPDEMKQASYTVLADHASSASARAALIDSLLVSVEQSSRREDFETAIGYCDLLLKLMGDAPGDGRVKRVREKKEGLQRLAERMPEVEQAMAILVDAPDDPDANLVVGRHLCFVRGDWDEGLPRLARGSHEQLKRVARWESTPEGRSDPLRLADGWWDLAEQLDDAEALFAKVRAASWYRKAIGTLKGITRLRVEKRIEQVGALPDPMNGVGPVGDDAAVVADPSGQSARPYFATRFEPLKEKTIKEHGQSDQAREAIKRGLEWLRRNQQVDGSWSMKGPYEGGGVGENVTAATAMAMLVFLGEGHTHQAGDFQKVVGKAKDFLLSRQAPSGLFAVKARQHEKMYAQALATIAIGELYGMTQDQKLLVAANRAAWFAADAQSPQGGWRYEPKHDSDTSVTGWFVKSLYTARASGIHFDDEVFANASRYLDSASTHEGSAYSYQPKGSPSPAMTAEALLSRYWLGWNPDRPAISSGVDAVLATAERGDLGDVYLCRHLTELLHHVGGNSWKRWNGLICEKLPEKQVSDGPERGSWAPERDRWGRNAGRLYTTSLSLMCLQACYSHPAERHAK